MSEIKEMNDPTLKVGDTVRMEYPPKYKIERNIYKSEWISVKNEYPEKEGRYLTFGEPFGISTEYWRHDKEWQDDPYQCITHWMPLPEPPINE